MSKFLQRLIGISIILVLVGFLGFKVVENGIDPEKVLNNMDEALEKGDFEYLKSKLEMVDGKELSEEAAKHILTVMKENSIMPSSIPLASEIDPDPDTDGQSLYPVRRVQKGKEKLIYDDYKLVFEYYDVIVETNLLWGNFEAHLNGKKIDKPLHSNVELYLEKLEPGPYTIDIKYGHDLEHSAKEEFSLAEFSRQDTAFFLDMTDAEAHLKNFKERIPFYIHNDGKVNNVYVYSSFDPELGDVYLIENGKKTDKIINDGESVMAGPIYEGDVLKLQGQVEIDGEVYKSEEYSFNINSMDELDIYIDYTPPYEPTEEDFRGYFEGFTFYKARSYTFAENLHIEDYVLSGSKVLDKNAERIKEIHSDDLYFVTIESDVKNIEKIKPGEYKVVVEEKLVREFGSAEERIQNKPIIDQVEYIVKFEGEVPYIDDMTILD